MEENKELMDKEALEKHEILEKAKKVETYDIGFNTPEVLDFLQDNRIMGYKNQVTESHFINEYLVLFYKLITTKDEVERSNLMTSDKLKTWISIATKSREVEVIKDGTREVLFSVPAVFGYGEVDGELLSNYSTNYVKNFSFSKLMNFWYNERKYSGEKANILLEKHLNAIKDMALKDNKEMLKNRWYDIFNRYRKELNIDEVKEIKKEVKENKKEDTNMDLGDFEW